MAREVVILDIEIFLSYLYLAVKPLSKDEIYVHLSLNERDLTILRIDSCNKVILPLMYICLVTITTKSNGML